MLSITEHISEGDCNTPEVVPSTLAHPTRTLEPSAILYEAGPRGEFALYRQ